jgi:hypothetical protein
MIVNSKKKAMVSNTWWVRAHQRRKQLLKQYEIFKWHYDPKFKKKESSIIFELEKNVFLEHINNQTLTFFN